MAQSNPQKRKPAEFVSACLLTHALVDDSTRGAAYADGVDAHDVSRSEAALDWFRNTFEYIGDKRGEFAQQHVGEFLKRLLDFDEARLSGLQLAAVEDGLLPFVCLAQIDERIKESNHYGRSGGGGGPSDLCRSLRFASAATRWAFATVQHTLARRRLDECETLVFELDRLCALDVCNDLQRHLRGLGPDHNLALRFKYCNISRVL